MAANGIYCCGRIAAPLRLDTGVILCNGDMPRTILDTFVSAQLHAKLPFAESRPRAAYTATILRQERPAFLSNRGPRNYTQTRNLSK
jgi:hypothetical protein